MGRNPGPQNSCGQIGVEGKKGNWISSLQSLNPTIDPQPEEISGELLQYRKWD